MKRMTLVAAAVLLALAANNVFAKQPSPAGTLVIIGGALRFDNSDVWKRIVRHAAETRTHAASSTTVSTAAVSTSAEQTAIYRPKIAVFPTASGDPQKAGSTTAEALQSYGADAFVVPVSSRMDIDPRTAVNDPALIEQVKNADGVYFTGGQQARIITCLLTEEGGKTPMLEAVWDVYRKGGVVAGTSAGAAVMSHIMYRDAKRILPTMQNGVTMGKEIDHGLGFLDSSWFVEQHTLVRGRFARAIVAMKAHDIKYGVGVDENTALVVKNDDMEVVGYRGAIVMDMSEAKDNSELKGFNVQNVKLTYLDHGDKIHLSTRALVPSSRKQDGTKLDPKSPEFEPESGEKLFTNDILGNTTAVDLMCKLINNRNNEAVGLAFDGQAAAEGAVQGFEFRFYRGDDTIGWSCSMRGDETFTVSNMRLDIRPIEIAGPIYKQP